MKLRNPFARKYFKPFKELKNAEKQLDNAETTGGLTTLQALLAQERVLDYCRPLVFECYKHGGKKVTDYVFREYMVRHRISEFALKLDKSITDKIVGEEPYEKSVVAMHVKNRELYPKPVKKEICRETPCNKETPCKILQNTERQGGYEVQE